MDVLGGRTLATYDLAQLLANKPAYVGINRHGVEIDDFNTTLIASRAELTKALESACGKTVVACARQDHSRFSDATRNRSFYDVTQTYGLPVVFSQTSSIAEDVAKLAPEAGYLLTAAFPYLTLAQADDILTSTEGPGGGFLDSGSAFGVYSRLNLYRAAEEAIAAAPKQSATLPAENGRRPRSARRCRLSRYCEPTPEERSAANLHATFWGVGVVTTPDDPVGPGQPGPLPLEFCWHRAPRCGDLWDCLARRSATRRRQVLAADMLSSSAVGLRRQETDRPAGARVRSAIVCVGDDPALADTGPARPAPPPRSRVDCPP